MLGGFQSGVVSGIDGDVVCTVVGALAIFSMDSFAEADQVMVVLAQSDIRAVAGTLLADTAGLERQQGNVYF